MGGDIGTQVRASYPLVVVASVNIPAADPAIQPERLAVMVRELSHRCRNLLGIVDALAERTARESVTLNDFMPAYRGRLAALARAQSLLFPREEAGMLSVRELLAIELSALTGHLVEEDRRIVMNGWQDMRLPAESVPILALAIHELVTNSVKYGALAARGGILTLSWQAVEVDGKSYARIVWEEVLDVPRNGHGPGEKGTGFGRELIERALPLQLGARTRYALTAEGVYCTLDVPCRIDPSGHA